MAESGPGGLHVTKDQLEKELLRLRLELARDLPTKAQVDRIEQRLNGINLVELQRDVADVKRALLSPDKVGEMIASALSTAHARTWSTWTRVLGALAASAAIGTFILSAYLALGGK